MAMSEEIKAQVKALHSQTVYTDKEGVNWFRTANDEWTSPGGKIDVKEMIRKMVNDLTGVKETPFKEGTVTEIPLKKPIKRTQPKKYSIDWSDSSYPTIVLYEEGVHTDPQTFMEAKQEIIEYYQDQITFARHMISQTRALRARNITKEGQVGI